MTLEIQVLTWNRHKNVVGLKWLIGNSFLSFSVVRLYVSFGLPLFLFPSGVQLSAMHGWELASILSTWPIHYKHLMASLWFRIIDRGSKISPGQKQIERTCFQPYYTRGEKELCHVSHMTLEIQVLAWNRYKNVAGLNRLIGVCI
jgi:hypothetical protein